EIACDTMNGVPFCTVGEQEQASNVCNSQGYNNHATVSGCRVAIFPWNGSGFAGPTFLQDTTGNPVRGTQNQALFQFNGMEYMVGATHAVLGGYDTNFYLWKFQVSSSSGSGRE